jgi:hypothetical protein
MRTSNWWRPLFIGISMDAMAYREEALEGAAGQALSLGTAASDMPAPSAQVPARPFQRPGSDVLNAAIPVVFIGRNRHGFWVARDADGKFGGLFWNKESALRFVKRAAASTGCATVFPQAQFELDIKNDGSPLIGCISVVRRFLTPHVDPLIGTIRKTLGF